MHYNDVFTNFWYQNGFDVVYQPSCLQRPYSGREWPIKFPKVNWTDRTVVVMHCQDFLSINEQGCPELESIQQHFGDQAHRVIVVHWNYDLYRVYDGPLNLVHFPTHTYEILENLKTQNYNGWQKEYTRPRTRRWQCLNGIARPHRRLVYDWLRDKPNGIVNLRNEHPLPQDSYDEFYKWTGFNLLNEDNFIRLTWLYSTTEINIVTETQYYESPGIISEKTVLALLAGQVPIIVGYRGIVEDCRRLGFDMFDDVVDHSYDDCDDATRWRQALELNRDLLLGDQDISHLKYRLEQQREWVLHQWPSTMIDRYVRFCRGLADCLAKT